MQPTASDVHINTALTNMSIAFFQDANDFIADKVFPNIPVDNKSNLYFIYNRGDFNRDEMQVRAPSTESSGGGYTLGTGTYNAQVWALHKDVDDQIRANSDSVLKPDSDAMYYVSNKALIRREAFWANKFFNTGTWTNGVVGTANTPPAGGQLTQWNNAVSTPIEDIRKAKTIVHLTGGMKPNKLVLSRPVYDVLLDHPDFIDRVKYGQTAGKPAQANLDIMAQIWELDEVLVMDSIVNTAAQGLAESNAFIGGKSALLVYAPNNPGIQTPSAGYTFSWTGYLGAGSQGQRVLSFRIERLKSYRIEIEMAFDMVQTSADLGYFFSGIVA